MVEIETIIASVITAALTALATFLIQERRLRRDFELDRDRLRTEFMAEQVARKLLESEKWKKRSFLLIFPRPIHQSLYDSFKYPSFLMEKRGNRLI